MANPILIKLAASILAVLAVAMTAAPAQAQVAPPTGEIATLTRECYRGDRNAMIQCYVLAARYMYGRGVPKDLQRARELFARSCDGMIADACNGFAYLSNSTSERAAYFGKACQLGFQDACKPWAGNAYELGYNAYLRLSKALLAGDKWIETVEQAENLRARAIGDLTAAARNDPALTARANDLIAKLRALEIRAAPSR